MADCRNIMHCATVAQILASIEQRSQRGMKNLPPLTSSHRGYLEQVLGVRRVFATWLNIDPPQIQITLVKMKPNNPKRLSKNKKKKKKSHKIFSPSAQRDKNSDGLKFSCESAPNFIRTAFPSVIEKFDTEFGYFAVPLVVISLSAVNLPPILFVESDNNPARRAATATKMLRRAESMYGLAFWSSVKVDRGGAWEEWLLVMGSDYGCFWCVIDHECFDWSMEY